MTATNVQDAIDEMRSNIITFATNKSGGTIRTITLPEKLRIHDGKIWITCYMDNVDIKEADSAVRFWLKNRTITNITKSNCCFIGSDGIIHNLTASINAESDTLDFTNETAVTSDDELFWLYISMTVS